MQCRQCRVCVPFVAVGTPSMAHIPILWPPATPHRCASQANEHRQPLYRTHCTPPVHHSRPLAMAAVDTAALKALAAKIAAQVGVPDAAAELPDKALGLIATSKATTRESRNDRRFPNTNQVRPRSWPCRRRSAAHPALHAHHSALCPTSPPQVFACWCELRGRWRAVPGPFPPPPHQHAAALHPQDGCQRVPAVCGCHG